MPTPLVQIKIDQASKPAGLPGQAREDLDLGTPVLLTAVGGPFRAYRWTIIDKAIDFGVEPNVISGANLTASTAASTQVTPIDIAGTYLVKIEVDSGSGLGRTANDVTTLTFYAGPTLAARADELPQRIPAAREYEEHNVPNVVYPAGNSVGWAYAVGRWIGGILRRLFRVAPRAGALIATEAPTVVIELKKLYISSVTFDGTDYTVNLDPPFPDPRYGVFVSPHRGADFGVPLQWEAHSQTTSSFKLTFYDSSFAVTGADFAVSVGLGGGS